MEDEDAPAIVAACQDPEIARYSPHIPFPYRVRDADEWLASLPEARATGRALDLATAGVEDEVLGAVALTGVNVGQRKALIGYWVAPQAPGRGVASTAVRLLAGWAFGELGLLRLGLTIDPENIASQRVAESCGAVREGLLRSHLRVRSTGEQRDSFIYGLLASDLR